jgi:hypothetical protein
MTSIPGRPSRTQPESPILVGVRRLSGPQGPARCPATASLEATRATASLLLLETGSADGGSHVAGAAGLPGLDAGEHGRIGGSGKAAIRFPRAGSPARPIRRAGRAGLGAIDPSSGLHRGGSVSRGTSRRPGSRDGARRLRCASLLQPVFEIDVLRCPCCGSTLRFIAATEDPTVARKALVVGRLVHPTACRGPQPLLVLRLSVCRSMSNAGWTRRTSSNARPSWS